SSNPSTSAGLRCFGDDLLSWEPGVRSIAVKCDLCEFREQGPACIDACPSQALTLVNDKACTAVTRARRECAATANPEGAPAFTGSSLLASSQPLDSSSTEGTR
ncbi:MAG: 4Fe-4S dicluster domain-containing protein, partial [Aeromonas sp.]